MSKILCVRHGDYVSTTGELTPDGVKNVLQLKTKLDRWAFAPVDAYCSATPRATETARLLAPNANHNVLSLFQYDELNAEGEIVGSQMAMAEKIEKSGRDTLVVMHSYIPAFFAFAILKIRKKPVNPRQMERMETQGLGNACGWFVEDTMAKYVHF